MTGPDSVQPANPKLGWIVGLLIGLGALVLVGATVAGVVLAMRAPNAAVPDPADETTVFEAPLVEAPPAVVAPFGVPKQPPPRSHEPAALPASPPGEHFGSGEKQATFPVSGTQPIWGSADAAVTIALFGDLECPHTKVALRRLEAQAVRFGPRLRLVFYQRPLAERSFASEAAQALTAVAVRAGPDAAFQVLSRAARGASVRAELGGWLRDGGIHAPLAELAKDPAVVARLADDQRLAAELDVQETPTLFVNGRRALGPPTDASLSEWIEEEVRGFRWLTAQGMQPRQAYELRVRRNVIGLTQGVENRACVPTERAPAQGSAGAPVTIVEFADFECVHCRSFEPVLSATLARYPGKVRRVWRTFLGKEQRGARRAAAFALAARELAGESAFWAMQQALFAVRDGALSEEGMRTAARRVGLDPHKLATLARSASVQRTLDMDRELAESLELKGTPTLFVNGREVSGALPQAALDAILREELAAAGRIVEHGTKAERIAELLCEPATP